MTWETPEFVEIPWMRRSIPIRMILAWITTHLDASPETLSRSILLAREFRAGVRNGAAAG